METAFIGLLAAFIGLLGAAIGAIITLYISGQERIQRFKLVAIEKRLKVHQEAFGLCYKMYQNPKQKDAAEVFNECRLWWIGNNLYLEPKSRKAFEKCRMGYFVYSWAGDDNKNPFESPKHEIMLNSTWLDEFSESYKCIWDEAYAMKTPILINSSLASINKKYINVASSNNYSNQGILQEICINLPRLAYMSKDEEKFIEEIAKNRKMKIEKVREVANGLIYHGEKALKLKLVDKLGGLKESKKIIEKKGKFKNSKVIEYKQKVTLLSKLNMVTGIMGKSFAEGIYNSISNNKPELR